MHLREVIPKLPTPIALVGRRLCAIGNDSSADTFLSASYLFESYLKLTTLCMVSGLEPRAHDIAYELAHLLVRSDGLGQWHSALSRAIAHPVSGFLPAGYQPFVSWFSKKRSKADDVWFDTVRDAISNMFRFLGLHAMPEPDMRKVHAALQALVQLRNKTKAHGAVGPDFFSKANEFLIHALTELITRCPLCQSRFVVFSKRPDGRMKGVWLSGPTPKHMKDDELPMGLVEPAIYVFPSGTESPIRVKLIDFNPELSRFFVPNGAWSDKDHSAEFIDYSTGEYQKFQLRDYARTPVSLPPSETHGTETLEIQSNVFGNLPIRPQHYVNRPILEATLFRLLNDKNHHIITLHGTGGVGKTSLALYASHEIARSSAPVFEQVLWFSARDLDLRPRGPVPVRPAIQTLQQIAEQYSKLFGGNGTLQHFADVLEGKIGPAGGTLFVFDNFETLADPRELHEFLDTHTILPNKVLITSRERAFKADYPIEVTGMEWAEADELLVQLGRQLLIEGLLTEERRKRLFEFADGHPYVMRVFAGEIASTGRYTPPDSIMAKRDDVLDAVFERSFVRLSDGGRWIYLLVSNWKSPIPEVLLLAVGIERQRQLDDGIEECLRASLIGRTETADGQACLESPQVARIFGRKKLRGDSDRLIIEEDLRVLQQFGVIQQGTGQKKLSAIVESFSEDRVKVLRNLLGAERTTEQERVDRLLTQVSEKWPCAWRYVARFRSACGDSGIRIEEAARRAVEADPNNPELWLDRAKYAKARSDIHTEIASLVSFVELNPRDVKAVSDAANRINPLLKELPLNARTIYIATVRDTMERLSAELEPTDRSRLAWLYLNENNTQKAREHAEEGLKVDGDNQHCLNVLKRIDDTY